jgi:putative chitinase
MTNVLTVDIMRNIIGANRDRDRLQQFVDNLNKYMPEYDINTLPRIQFFLAIALGETGGFLALTENMRYTSADRVKTVFGSSRFQNTNINKYVFHATNNKDGDKNLANRVYGNRYGNGPETVDGDDPETGDGWIYRGGGLFQLTFKENYQRFATSIGMSLEDLVNDIRTIPGAVRSACHYTQNRNILPEADKNTAESFIEACKRVGRCPDGNNYAKKRDYLAKCRAFIGGNGIVQQISGGNTTQNTRLNYLTSSELNVFLDAKHRIGN